MTRGATFGTGFDSAWRRIEDDVADATQAARDGARSASAAYDHLRRNAGERTAKAVARGAARFDAAYGDAPWRALGFDERASRIGRTVLLDVLPQVAGDRVASMMDGLAVKGGLLGAGLALRLPLKALALPILAGLATLEAATAVEEIKAQIDLVAAAVDAGRSNPGR